MTIGFYKKNAAILGLGALLLSRSSGAVQVELFQENGVSYHRLATSPLDQSNPDEVDATLDLALSRNIDLNDKVSSDTDLFGAERVSTAQESDQSEKVAAVKAIAPSSEEAAPMDCAVDFFRDTQKLDPIFREEGCSGTGPIQNQNGAL